MKLAVERRAAVPAFDAVLWRVYKFEFPAQNCDPVWIWLQKGSELTVDGAPLVVGRAVESRMLSVAVEVLVGEGAEERETSLFDRLKWEIMMMTKG